tara:strand:- start:1779 stop:2534 length:756 start_codon:yes stop_codon:yes gene_type:complete
MPSVLPMDMMQPMPKTEEEIVAELPPEPVDEAEIFSKKEVKKNTSSEKELEKIEKQEAKEELEMIITKEAEKPKKKKRGKATKSPEELAAHMSKMRAASLKKRQEKKKQKDLLKKQNEELMFDKPSSPLVKETTPLMTLDEQPKPKPIPNKQSNTGLQSIPSAPIDIPKATTKRGISLEDKLRLTEMKLFEYQIREDERNKIKSKNENKAKAIAQNNIQQPNRWGRKSAIAKWANVPTYKSDDPYDVFKIN